VAKEDEIAYIGRLGDIGKKHAMDKPWSDDLRGMYLQESIHSNSIDIIIHTFCVPTFWKNHLEMGASSYRHGVGGLSR
jgi:hypothetical protein